MFDVLRSDESKAVKALRRRSYTWCVFADFFGDGVLREILQAGSGPMEFCLCPEDQEQARRSFRLILWIGRSCAGSHNDERERQREKCEVAMTGRPLYDAHEYISILYGR